MGMGGASFPVQSMLSMRVRAAMAIVDGVRRAREADESRGEHGFTIKLA